MHLYFFFCEAAVSSVLIFLQKCFSLFSRTRELSLHTKEARALASAGGLPTLAFASSRRAGSTGVLLPSGCRSGAGRALTGLSFSMQTVLLPSPGPSEHTGQGQVRLGAAPSVVSRSPPPLASVSCFLDGLAACSPPPGDWGLG